MADPVGKDPGEGSGEGLDKGWGDDAFLTAYLDGELALGERAALERRLSNEPALKARLDELTRGGRAFRPAFDALLAAAPSERLQAMLAGLAAKHAAGRNQHARAWTRRLAAIAAALLIFAVGAGAGFIVPRLVPAQPPGWRQVVAEYQQLTTTETLAAIPVDPTAISNELATLGGKLDLDLSAERLELPDAALKRAQLFEFRGRPLVQVAYLSAEAGPIALCIINNGRPDDGLRFEEREGFNIVYWTTGGRGYMLIGKAARNELEVYAGNLAARFS